MATAICSFLECGLPVRGAKLGLCNGHRLQVQRGRTLKPLKSQFTPFEKFLRYVTPTDTESCWLWQGAINRDGYGLFQYRGVTDKAHRASFLFAYGYLPVKPWLVDHSCRTRNCVNPAHLSAVTYGENAQNREVNSNNTSGFPGVRWREEVGKWRVKVGLNRQSIDIGYFEDYDRAVEASRDFRRKNHPNWKENF